MITVPRRVTIIPPRLPRTRPLRVRLPRRTHTLHRRAHTNPCISSSKLSIHTSHRRQAILLTLLPKMPTLRPPLRHPTPRTPPLLLPPLLDRRHPMLLRRHHRTTRTSLQPPTYTRRQRPRKLPFRRQSILLILHIIPHHSQHLPPSLLSMQQTSIKLRHIMHTIPRSSIAPGKEPRLRIT